MTDAHYAQIKEFANKYPINPELARYLFGNDYSSSADSAKFEGEIRAHFDRINTDLGYGFSDEDSVTYQGCYQAALVVAELLEHNNNGDEVASRTFNMLALFNGDLQEIDSLKW